MKKPKQTNVYHYWFYYNGRGTINQGVRKIFLNFLDIQKKQTGSEDIYKLEWACYDKEHDKSQLRNLLFCFCSHIIRRIEEDKRENTEERGRMEGVRMRRTIGILAHVDAGKTSLAEQLLFHTKSIRNRGRVDHRNAFLDTHSLEKERGITIFSDQAVFHYGENTYYLVDTPGHADFSSEMERALQIMDAAILVVSCVEGIQGHTETVWHLLREKEIPTFIFLNKTDRKGADPARVMAELKRKFSPHCIYFTSDFQQGSFSQSLVEEIAEQDDVLLEMYFDKGYAAPIWLDITRRRIEQGKLFPCFSGSALLDEGIEEFLYAMDAFLLNSAEKESDAPFQGIVYKIRHDGGGNRMTFLKVTGGTLKVKEEIFHGQQQAEKVNEIRIYHGGKYESVTQVQRGDLCAVTGPGLLKPGQGIGADSRNTVFKTHPMLTARVQFDASISPKVMLEYFRRLEEEEPLLQVRWDEALQELHVHVLGVIQLEVLQQLILERYGVSVTFGDCEILYQETIASQVIGYGHFEPLRHYAEVQLLLSPAERNKGILFDSRCPTDVLEGSYQNLIRTHVFEKEHRGILTGSPLTDVQITLLTGRAHLKHTEGGDFREATYRAIRQGLEQAESLLLEPYYSFEAEVKLEQMGRLVADIQRLHGKFQPPEILEDRVRIQGRGPVATFMNYGRELVSFTGGKGRLRLAFDGYDICHNASEVIERIGYEKDKDAENPSGSVFCAKGAGYYVGWKEVAAHAHCPTPEVAENL